MVQPIASVATSLTLESASFIRDIRYAANQTALATTRMSQDVKKMQSGFAQAGRAVSQFANAFSSLFAVQQVLSAAKAVIDYSDAWQTAGNKISAAGSIAGRNAATLSEVAGIAIATRSGLEVTADLYAKLLRSSANLGVSLDQVAQATTTVNQAFKASGASTLEAENAVRQLAQALGSGVLQGDELRSIRENAPLLANAIAKEFNTTVAGLKALGAEGKLTSDRVFKAILDGQKPIGAAFATTNSTIGESFENFNTALTAYIGKASQAHGITALLAGGMNTLAVNFDTIATSASRTNPFTGAIRLWGFYFEQASTQWHALVDAISPPQAIVDVGNSAATAAEQIGAFSQSISLDLDQARRALSQSKPIAAKDLVDVKFDQKIDLNELLFDPTQMKKQEDLFGLLTQQAGEFVNTVNSTSAGNMFQPLDLQVQMFNETLKKTHDQLISDLGTPYEQWQQKLDKIRVTYPDLSDQTIAAAAAERAYRDALDKTASTLEIISPAMADFLEARRTIAGSGLDLVSSSNAGNVALLKLADGQQAYAASLGAVLTPQEEFASNMRKLQIANIQAVEAQHQIDQATKDYQDTLQEIQAQSGKAGAGGISAEEAARLTAEATTKWKEQVDDLNTSLTSQNNLSKAATGIVDQFRSKLDAQSVSFGLLSQAQAELNDKLRDIKNSGRSLEDQAIASANAQDEFTKATTFSLSASEKYSERLKEIVKLYPDLAQQTKAAADAEREYRSAIDGTLSALGLILPSMTEFLQKKRDIAAASDLSEADKIRATEVAELDLDNARRESLTSLGAHLTLGEEYKTQQNNIRKAELQRQHALEDLSAAQTEYSAVFEEASRSHLDATEFASVMADAEQNLADKTDLASKAAMNANEIGRATADTVSAHSVALEQQAASLGLVSPALADYHEKLLAIDQSDQDAEGKAKARILAQQEYTKALSESLGVDLSPEVQHAENMQRIADQANSAAMATAAYAAEASRAYEAQLAVNNAVGLSTDPLQQLEANLLRINAAQAAGSITAVQSTQATIGAYSGVASSVLDLTGQVTGAFSSLFKDNKALAIASAVINTAEAITKTLAQFGATPFGIAAAAVAAAVGAAQIATIASTQPGSSKAISKPSGKGASASGSSSAGSAASTGPKNKSSSQTVNITVQGSGMFSQADVRELIGHINEAVGDGVHLRVR